MTCHGVPVYVITRGVVVVDHGKVTVTRGSGKFVPRKPWCDHVYSRVAQRDKVVVVVVVVIVHKLFLIGLSTREG